MITSLGGVTYGEAIGAYITCAVLVTICGLTGSFERLVKKIPASLAAALLAGILFKIGSEIFVAAQHRTALVLGMFFTYLVVKRLSPRYAVLARAADRHGVVRLHGVAGLQRRFTWKWRRRCGPHRTSPWLQPSASASRCSWWR